MKREVNYRGLFILAMSLITLGIILSNYFDHTKSVGIVFISVGGLFLIVSMKNKNKWVKEK